MCLKMSPILKTLPPSICSKKFCLASLMDLLAEFSGPDLIRKLSRIGNILHTSLHDGKNRQGELIETYASTHTKADMMLDLKENRQTVLFHRCALKLLDELLRINPIRTVLPLKKLPHGAIDNLFLYANTLISYLESEPPGSQIVSYSESAKIFYSRRNIDRVAAIGRARMYDFQEFSIKLRGIGIEIDEYFKAISALCCHIENKPFIELEFPQSIKSLPAGSQKILLQYLPLLTAKIQSQQFDLNQVETKLPELYFADYLCRQKPLILLGNRYYCLQPKFLWTAFAELPYYLLLDFCKRDGSKVKELGSKWGYAFEDNFTDLGRRVFGDIKCEGYKCKHSHRLLNLPKDHQISDLFISENNFRIAIEFKGAQPCDKIKLGDRAKAISKFINLDENKGVPQLVRDIEAYRNETSYSEDIYSILVCWGPIPLTKDFDDDLQLYLKNSTDYQKHLINPKNKPLIYLDAGAAELLFGAIRQGLSIKSILDRLVSLPPSQVLYVIIKEIQENNLEKPYKYLYREEIERFLCTGRSLFN